MRYSIAILAFAAAALASPTGTPPSCPGDGHGSPGGGSPGGGSPSGGSGTPASVCTGALYSQAQCCATDVLGAVGLNCAVPATAVSSTDDFIETCAKTGQQAKCCVIPVAGQDLLCTNVSPSS
ncbi:hydrophobin [Phaeosphaeria sp. MPI-PUGE-AT-0046c]|nr:hydrophobin [Phaeosphaeria sp. MPI-PUGE-AT-0046c]